MQRARLQENGRAKQKACGCLDKLSHERVNTRQRQTKLTNGKSAHCECQELQPQENSLHDDGMLGSAEIYKVKKKEVVHYEALGHALCNHKYTLCDS